MMRTDEGLQYFHTEKAFALESGRKLPRLTLAYHTFGKKNASGSNVVWIVHALTADSNVVKWWEGVVGPGLALDTDKYFVVCANTIGSHYGSTGPLSIDCRTQQPYFHEFPQLTNRDAVNAFQLLASHLRIKKVKALIGPSLGGQIALEWAIMYPTTVSNLVLIATNAVHSPYGIAFNESQRMAIQLDPTWIQSSPVAGLAGLRVARSIALISYRTKYGYDSTQSRSPQDKLYQYRSASYQRYQGEKLAKRFNAYSYVLLSQMMDSHDVARGRGTLGDVLGTIRAKTTVISISSDILFPPAEQELLARLIPDAALCKIDSAFGHDGFLVESKTMSDLLTCLLGGSEDNKPALCIGKAM